MKEDPTSSLLAAVAAPVRRWPERRRVVLASAAALFVAIFALRELVTGTGDALSLLYVIPIALLALELGIRAGVAAALVSTAAVGVWIATVETGISAVGLLVRALIYLSVGVIAGRFSDRMRSHSVRDESLLRSGLDLARLDEREDLLALLSDHIERAVEVGSVSVEIEGAPAVRRGAPGGEVLRVPVVSREQVRGWIEVSAGEGRRFSPEDRLILEAIALQAAVAAENRRLLTVEREQAELRSEIEQMRKRLGDQLRNASQLIEHHEQERRGIARRLHDEAAQAMAAALLTVGLLERGADREMSRPQLEEVRSQVKACIVDLRHIAGSLRPAALDEMGLEMALERFVDLEQERDGRSVSFSFGELPPRLPADVETATYRAIEEMLQALKGAQSVSVSVGADRESVEIVMEAQAAAAAQVAGGDQEPGWVRLDLTATRARVELIGGSLEMSSAAGSGERIVVRIPIALEGD